MTRVVVTGGSGKVGRACVADLLAHRYEVVNIDVAAPATDNCGFVQADLSDFGQALEVLSGMDDRLRNIDALVHLAALPAAPGRTPNAVIFKVNTLSTYNVFEAAKRAGIRNIVWASSETVLGIPYDTPPPYGPVDEEYPGRSGSAYPLSKLLGEEMAKQFCRWDPELKIIGLRLSNVMEPEDYARFPSFEADARIRKWNLWAYVDARDAAQAIRLAIEAPLNGAKVFIIANADTVMSRPSAELMAEVFPSVLLKGDIASNDTLISIAKARRLLGYDPQHGWRGA